jgi:hypothetical protein
VTDGTTIKDTGVWELPSGYMIRPRDDGIEIPIEGTIVYREANAAKPYGNFTCKRCRNRVAVLDGLCLVCSVSYR